MATKSEHPPPFKLERYFMQYEHNTKFMLSCSDAETIPMRDLVNMADEECKALWEDLRLGYTESPGHHLLRSEVTKVHYGIEKEDVLIVTPQEGIFIAMKVLAETCKKQFGNAQPHAVVTFPGYQSLYENLRSFGCDITYWRACFSEQHGWTFNMDELKTLIHADTRILVLNFPHNPTGFTPEPSQWKEIIDLCYQRGIYVFSDEMYRGTNHAPDSVIYPSACALYASAVTLFGLSKSFGLPGLRVGWLCTRNKELMTGFAEFKDYLTICSPGPSEILSIIALRNKEHLISRVVTLLRRNLEVAGKFFSRYPSLFDWKPSAASTTAFLRLKGKALTLSPGGATGFCDALRKEAEILALPSAMFDVEDEYIRIGFGRENFPEVLEVLGKFLESHFN